MVCSQAAALPGPGPLKRARGAMIGEGHEQLGFGHGRREQSFVAPRLGTHARRPPVLLPTSAGNAHYVTDSLARGGDPEGGVAPAPARRTTTSRPEGAR